MGRAIEMENKVDKLERRLKLVEDALEELVQTRVHHIDLHEETKEKKTNDEGSGDSDVKPDNGNKKKSNRNNKNAKSSK